ncbi:MAG TPA: hypothetical protein VER58_20650 [Thermoanaerobaculia bacterium]|nr:hypothetical protein [Thermoanaerobaculia bacterium]
MELEALRERIERLNEKLLPIANRPIPFGADLRAYSMPNDREANDALVDAIELYSRSDAAAREKVREIFRINYAFAWAAQLPFPPDTKERFRQHLIQFSIIDQGRDWRDQILWMRDLLRSPFATRDVVEEVAAMSGDWARDQIARTSGQ